MWRFKPIVFLGKFQQLRVEGFTRVSVFNGPAVKVVNPLFAKKIQKVNAEMLGTLDYAKVKDLASSAERIECGPKVLFLGAYETVTERGSARTMSKTQYLFVDNRLTGHLTTRKGPCVWFPQEPHEVGSSVQQATALQEDEYVKVKDTSTGQRWVERGPSLLFLEPTWVISQGVTQAWTLKSYEYLRLLDKVTGKVTVHRGEQTVFPGPEEELLDGKVLTAIDLAIDEYVKLEDKHTGDVRVVRGVARVFLGANEQELEGGKKQAVQVDEEHAVLVRDTSSGQLRLATEKQLFVPGPNDKIEEVRSLIKLDDHEAMIVKDKDGTMHYHYGNPGRQTPQRPRSFFLQPYDEIVHMLWSSGLRRKDRNLNIERFDCRPQYMWFEFDCRTADNVELTLEVTMFWEVVDLPKLVGSTGNLPGDVYNQARSLFIKHVAQATLKQFMEQLHNIAGTIHKTDSAFYAKRGVSIHSLEVTRYKCAETRTSEVLQQIIEETTNRLNRLSQAESENEVKIFKMQGEIEQYRLNQALLELKHAQAKDDAQVAGAAEAMCAGAFVQGLKSDVPKLEDRLLMWQTLRKTDALKTVADGGANLYYTPNDIDLSIKTEHKL